SYMVPTRYVELDGFPLTSNGKIDRSALPAPSTARPELGVGYVAPRTAIEQVLADIWSDLLQVDGIGIHDDFVALGGHSLLAARAVAELRGRLEIEVGVARFLELRTLSALAEEVESRRRDHVGPAETAIAPAPHGLESVLSYAQQRHWLHHQLDPT